MALFPPAASPIRLLLSAGMILLMTGCMTPYVGFSPTGNPINPAEFTPVAADEVVVYVTRQPTVKYDELGILTFNTQAQYPDERNVFLLFRRKAAEVGADGVIMLETRDEFPRGSSAFLRRYAIYESGSITFRGLAIRHHAQP
jgi:hypothetical protein